jgi:hypothetical protein
MSIPTKPSHEETEKINLGGHRLPDLPFTSRYVLGRNKNERRAIAIDGAKL